MGCSSSQTAAAFFPCVLSTCPFHGVQSFRNQLLQLELPTRSQTLPANLLQCGLLSPQVPRSCQQPAPAPPTLGTSTCSSMGSSTGCHWICALPWTSMGCRATACLTMAFTSVLTRLQGRLCSGTWTTFSPSFFNDPGVCKVVSLTYSHFSILASVELQFFSLLRCIITEVLSVSLIGSAFTSDRSVLEPAGIGSTRHGGSF